MPVLDAGWQNWLAENVSRGCTPQSMVDAMMKAGFDRASADAAVQSVTSGTAVETLPRQRELREYQYDAVPVAAGNIVRAYDRDVKVMMRCDQPQVIVFGDLLSAEECDAVIERSRSKLKRSTTVNPDTGVEDVISRRTSEGTFFNRCEDDLIERLDRRVAALMNWPLENGEGFQILHYGVGGEYHPHFDYFPPEQPGSAQHIAQGGQRVSTLVMYLNDVEAGGETIFPEVGLSVAPRRGGAVYFRYFNGLGQIDPLTLHGGAPVLAGEKWIMTKWMRQRTYG